jgi:hypothetical protein
MLRGNLRGSLKRRAKRSQRRLQPAISRRSLFDRLLRALRSIGESDDSTDTGAKKDSMKGAQQQSRFLANDDPSPVKNPMQLCASVETRSSISVER